MAHDLVPKMSPYLDRHLVFPLLEFLQEKQVYPEEDILKAKIDLLGKTNMVDYGMDIHKALYRTEDVPEEMLERRADVVERMRDLDEKAAPIIQFLQDPAHVDQLHPSDKAYNVQLLRERFNIGQDQIEALYWYAKFQFECGNYSGAAEFLYSYRQLSSDADKSMSALWGKLAAAILMQKWEDALEDLNRLKEIIDSKAFTSPLSQLQQRTWLLHWSLFVFFNHENGNNLLIDMFFQEKYLNAIQQNAHHLLRYLATAVILNKRRRQLVMRELMKVIQQESYTYADPITQFLECLYIEYDFEGAQQKLKECEEVLANDYFIGSVRGELMDNARNYIFETYCKIHQCLDTKILSEKLSLSPEDAERWIVNLIRQSRLEAKIDSKAGTVIMTNPHPSVYEQIIEKTKSLTARSFQLATNVTAAAAAQKAGI
ncbi:translation initiation factor 3 subunit E [Klebsormidium nitens]|uniref:Eukaryotic translation initiation factor 3 subunit E n=1 Tax=Klebsormidium nitens TaxID=105231 RepID=A0A1Y1HXP1_KLENI|nr:translation initiation factor 3 subunit E [Klebsormidium nitens]|eukprot:GAQ82532.1 translation initiation factor 3 subunit E [Klebsormidium nitens]